MLSVYDSDAAIHGCQDAKIEVISDGKEKFTLNENVSFNADFNTVQLIHRLATSRILNPFQDF